MQSTYEVTNSHALCLSTNVRSISHILSFTGF